MKNLALTVLTLVVFGCADQTGSGTVTQKTIRIGVLPDQSHQRLQDQYAPLMAYLEKTTSLDVELVIPANYSTMLAEFADGHLQLANFGGLTYTQAEHRSRAMPLIMRDTDLNFTSCFVVKTSDPRRMIKEFKGETIAFGPPLSTSGHLMPRRFLSLSGIEPEQFFSSIRHSSGHDETVQWVSDGVAAIGAANCVIAQSMLGANSTDAHQLRIISTTPTYANYVWAVQDSMDSSTRTLLRDAFLALDQTIAEHEEILNRLGAQGYVPAGRADFDDIRNAADALGLLDAKNSN
ncbi:MAG: phosphate/phosphite/phosphonate ABC transporter substrate-binding protein [Gammaproteobacteria bacterium]|nr:phosphate/phosphite/phosphonate ABC transporter substrate-binding protein [Gammaproteobacteria bacterium]